MKKIGDNEYSLAVIFYFQKPIDVNGGQMHLSIDGLQFFGPVGMEEEKPVLKQSIAGLWDFDVTIDDKFPQADTVNYRVVDPETAFDMGIVVDSFEVRPGFCRVELAIDYSRTTWRTKGDYDPSASGLVHKIDFMNTEIAVDADRKTYGFGSSDIIREKGDIVYGGREVDSFYFGDADEVARAYIQPVHEGRGGYPHRPCA